MFLFLLKAFKREPRENQRRPAVALNPELKPRFTVLQAMEIRDRAKRIGAAIERARLVALLEKELARKLSNGQRLSAKGVSECIALLKFGNTKA